LSWKRGKAAFRPLGLGTTNTRAPAIDSGLGPGPGVADDPTNWRYAVLPTNATTAGRTAAIVRARRRRPRA
jgi:hypothetical protein